MTPSLPRAFLRPLGRGRMSLSHCRLHRFTTSTSTARAAGSISTSPQRNLTSTHIRPTSFFIRSIPSQRDYTTPSTSSDSPSSSSSDSTSPSESSSTVPIKPYTYQDILSRLPPTPSSSPSSSFLLIDVREPSEYSAGHIPTAVNMPILTRPEAPFLPPEEFFDVFGFEKPGSGEKRVGEGGTKEVVFYCKAGVRSAAAVRLAGQAGWGKENEGKGGVVLGEYKGSWLDWVKNEEAKMGKGEGKKE